MAGHIVAVHGLRDHLEGRAATGTVRVRRRVAACPHQLERELEMAPPRLWFPRECNLHADPNMEILGDEHGPLGILTWEEILALGKLAERKGEATICARYTQLARRTWSPSARKTKDIVMFLEAGLRLLTFATADPQGFSATITASEEWRFKQSDSTGAERQKRYRDRKRNRSTHPARDVTGDVTGRDGNGATVNSDIEQLPPTPQGGRKTDHLRFMEEVSEIAADLFPDGPRDMAIEAVRQAAQYGPDKTRAGALVLARQWFPQLVGEEHAA